MWGFTVSSLYIRNKEALLSQWLRTITFCSGLCWPYARLKFLIQHIAWVVEDLNFKSPSFPWKTLWIPLLKFFNTLSTMYLLFPINWAKKGTQNMFPSIQKLDVLTPMIFWEIKWLVRICLSSTGLWALNNDFKLVVFSLSQEKTTCEHRLVQDLEQISEENWKDSTRYAPALSYTLFLA